MCGRYTLRSYGESVAKAFSLEQAPLLPCFYNIAPTQPVAAVRLQADGGKRELAQLRWGLIPSWSKDAKGAARMINARAETVAVKPAFRSAFRKRRCLVAADGFYEWQKRNGGKQPYYIRMQDDRPFAFAGLWEHWHGPDGEEIESCTIVTTEANELMKPIHERMPVIVPGQDYEKWLDPKVQDAGELTPLLKPYASAEMIAYPVSTRVNNPRNNDARCIEELK